MRTYAAYLRKSRAEGNESIDAVLARHKAALKKLAKDQNIGIVDWYEEVVSGENVAARPQVQALLDAVSDERYHAVLCMDIDRLGRGDMQDQGLILSTFRRSGTRIITPQKTYDLSDEMDETMTEMQAFLARQEYKMIRKRMHRGTIACLEEGGYIANAPYGYEQCRINKKPSLRIIPEEARFVRLAYDRYTSGVGAARIADELNALGAVPRRNAAWNKNSIRYMLRNAVYAGMIVFNQKKYTKSPTGCGRTSIQVPEDQWLTAPGLHEPIISMEQYDLAQKIRKEKDIPQVHLHRGTIQHQFAGIFRCAGCGKTMQSHIVKGGTYLYCNTPGCSASAKEAYVEEILLQSLADELSRLQHHPDDHLQEDLAAADQLIETLETELSKSLAKRPRLYAFLEDGVYDRSTFLERMELLENQIEDQQRRLDQARSDRDAIATSDSRILQQKLDTALTLWPESDQAARNALLKGVIADAEYRKDKKTKPRDFQISLTLRRF